MIKVQYGCHRVPESVRVNVRQVMTLAEFCEPIRYAVGVHRLSIFLREHKTVALVVFPEPYYLG